MSSSQLSTCSALQNSNQPMGQQEIQIKHHSPDEWASCLTSDPKKELTIHVRRLCCSRAPQAVQQRVPLDRASVTRCSAAWSMAPADYTLLPLQKKKYVPERTRQQDSQVGKTTKRIKGQTNLKTNKSEGGRQSGGCLRVIGVDGPQPSLVTSVKRRVRS